MDDAYTKLSLIAAQWTNAELGHLLDALRRDRSLTIKELTKYVEKKNACQINRLFTCILSVPEEQLFGQQKFPHPIRAEGAVDILEQTTKHVSPEDYLFSSATFEALNDHAAQLEKKEECSPPDASSSPSPSSPSPSVDQSSSSKNNKLRFPQLYRFLASAMRSKPLPPLNSSEAAAMLDLLACLVRVVQRVQRVLESPPEPDSTESCSSQNNRLREAWHKVANKVTDLMGIYLAACATIHWKGSLAPFSAKLVKPLARLHPIAPYFLLDSINPPKTLKATKALLDEIMENFIQLWQLPKLPDRFSTMKVDCLTDLSEPDYHLLVKRISAFALNPFSLSRSDMEPLQQLLDTMCLGDLSESIRFSDVFLTAAPDTLGGGGEMVVIPSEIQAVSTMPSRRNKRKRTTPRPVRYESDKQPRLQSTEACATSEVDLERTNSDEQPSPSKEPHVEVYSESNPVTRIVHSLARKRAVPVRRHRISQFFRRIPDETEKPITTQAIKKFIKVCDRVNQFPR